MTVTAPRGFRAAGAAAGIKTDGSPDLALVVNDGPADVAAGVFTSNRVCAAPVLWSRQAVADGALRAVVLNSGGANACTGEEGLADSAATADAVAGLLGAASHDVAVCSTGLIGERLPMGRLLTGVEAAFAGLSADGGADAARAIMTTDTCPKTAVFAGEGWSIGAMAKGAGMLAPALATMLVVITTDAVITAGQADTALRAATEVSLNRLDSDGCQSTNDTVLLLSSGASGVRLGTREFAAALTAVCLDLGRRLLGDAEGSSHDIEILVRGAASEADALEVGRAIARSNLFKCAVFGNDPNWGRVLATVGTTRAVFEPAELDVSFNGVTVCRGGAIGEDRSLVDLRPRRACVVVDLHAGEEQAAIWTNDLTYGYVRENAEYSS
ncbi:bifunctional glutamate N-acetyltransferase/amino-acid acetyltransferase ArgJ [uncultured Propionibacterium sp.]|uniref:bifunctional glutamate N-acetyltransferase/amino-acid acetyltransferase ArgJ n=1 Tax=uncultured Propionibacterium sp. TaxID=218066 RepID=UPI00292FB2A8|nr:bifunctional glutamate N-acetyltransferase/amino-acid acetyltransferase ArgJ [uncultured Propionibacterium sp.]